MSPYASGDAVIVLFEPLFAEPKYWVPGVVLTCDQPRGAKRYQCRVAIGRNGSVPFEARVYCGVDGLGEGIRPLTV